MSMQDQNISYPICFSLQNWKECQQLNEIGKVLEKPGNLAFYCSAFVLEATSLPVILQNVTVCLGLW